MDFPWELIACERECASGDSHENEMGGDWAGAFLALAQSPHSRASPNCKGIKEL